MSQEESRFNRATSRWIARTTRSEGSPVRIIDTSFFSLSAVSSHPCSSFIYRNRPRVKPVLRLGDGERIKYLIARVLATVSEQNGSYGSRFIIFFLLYSLLLFSLLNKYLAFIIPAEIFHLTPIITDLLNIQPFKYKLYYHWIIQTER